MKTHDSQYSTSQSEDRLSSVDLQTAANSKDENLHLDSITSEEYPEETDSYQPKTHPSGCADGVNAVGRMITPVRR